jgi:hypothetical protein
MQVVLSPKKHEIEFVVFGQRVKAREQGARGASTSPRGMGRDVADQGACSGQRLVGQYYPALPEVGVGDDLGFDTNAITRGSVARIEDERILLGKGPWCWRLTHGGTEQGVSREKIARVRRVKDVHRHGALRR